MRTAIVLAFAGMIGSIPAEIRYVDQRYGPDGDGSRAKPYDTIQEAIDDKTATEVIVFPGTYSERLNLAKSIRILGYDGPLTTRIESSAGGNVIDIGRGLDVWIEGVTLSSGLMGVYKPTAGKLHIRNCVICGNTSHGIFVARTETAVAPDVWIHNCVLVLNGGTGR